MVERSLSKIKAAGSIPAARSTSLQKCSIARGLPRRQTAVLLGLFITPVQAVVVGVVGSCAG